MSSRRGRIGSECGVFVLRGPEGGVTAVVPAGTALLDTSVDEGGVEVLVSMADQWGPVEVTTELLGAPPVADQGDRDDWEDVVEFSLTTTGPVGATDLIDNTPFVELVSAPGSYRVRVSARGRRAVDAEPQGRRAGEVYRFQAWPAPAGDPEVVRLTSSYAESVLNPPAAPVVPEAEAGVAAAARIGADVDRAPGARVLSGARGSVQVSRTVAGTRRRLFARCAHLKTWTHVWHDGGGWCFFDIDDFEFGSALDSIDQLSGGGAVRTQFLDLKSPARAVRLFEWMVSPDPAEPGIEDMVPFLPHPTRLTVTLDQFRDAEKAPWTTVTLLHEDLPVEWCEDLRTYWDYQLSIAEAYDFGTTG